MGTLTLGVTDQHLLLTTLAQVPTPVMDYFLARLSQDRYNPPLAHPCEALHLVQCTRRDCLPLDNRPWVLQPVWVESCKQYVLYQRRHSKGIHPYVLFFSLGYVVHIFAS
jgi:hypothetical protein